MATNEKTEKTEQKASSTKKVEFPSIPLPILASGGALEGWGADLKTLQKLEISKDNGKTWVAIKIKDKGEGQNLHPEQKKVLLFTALAVLTGSRADRGWAYKIWLAEQSKVVLQYFSNLRVRVSSPNSAVPGSDFKVTEACAFAQAMAPILKRSKDTYPPRSQTRSKSNEEESWDYSIV